MKKFVESGKVRAIGINNFKPRHIEEPIKYARIELPLNRIVIHPSFSEQERIADNRKYDITAQGRSPFGAGKNGVLDDPVLLRIAKKYNRSVAQIILRWNIRREILVIPRTTNPEYLIENRQIFDFALSSADMPVIDGLNRDEMWNPLSNPDIVPWE